MDKYTKLVLTVIAVSLIIIAIKLWEPREAHTGPFSSGPTVGDLMALREIKDQAKLAAARDHLIRSIPLVRVQGGQISADIN
jgi:hypothetical protein